MVEEYFRAEQFESVIFIGLGLVSMAVSLGIYSYYKSKLSLGLMIATCLLAIFQVSTGVQVYFGSTEQMESVNTYYESSMDKIADEEIPRMERVLMGYENYLWAETGVLLAGIILLIAGRKLRFLMGLGLGLIIQSVILLTLDVRAEKRAQIYFEHLIESTKHNES